MASPAQLMETISGATGVPLATVVDIDRRLVKAELRTKGGRGFNAAQMTALDAARLLTGILGSAQANTAAEAVERYAQTRVDRARSSDKMFTAVQLDDLAALPARHGFVDALTALIASGSSGSLARLIAAARDDRCPHIEIFTFTRATRGRIRISGLPNGLTASMEYVPRPAAPQKKSRRAPVAVAALDMGDLEQSRRITERTIFAVAKILA